ncbi:MAG: amidase family protein [Acidimicrobiia bacterium]|nr:amidase family protein [Acidimicrobiia bacterium]
MRVDEYAALDATALSAAVRDGAVTVPDVAAAATEAHHAVHERINAVLEWYDDPEPALADRLWSGVPYLRKDSGATEAGRRTERGSRLSAGWTAEATSPLVERWRRLGLQCRGRSAVPEFILHASTESAVHGVTRNPWNPETSAGGSSGGAAAAVAAGVVPVAHASDCAGSIRIPASVCGLVGLKPSRGRVPWADGTTGGGWGGIAEELVVTRSVRDLVQMLAASTTTADCSPGAPLRVSVVTAHWAGTHLDAVLVDAVEAVGQVLADAGHRVSAGRWPVPYDEVASLMDPMFGAGALAEVEAVAASTGRPVDDTTLEPLTLAYLEHVRSLTPAQLGDATARAAALSDRLDHWLGAFDVVVCSTLGRASLPLGRLASGSVDQWAAANDEFTPHSFVANITGWPALSLPWGIGPDGVPRGVQLLACRGGDEQLLAIADQLAGVAPPMGRPVVWAGA